MADGERLNWPNVARHVAAATLIRGNGCIAVHSPCVAPGRGWERCHNWVRGLKHKSGILRPIGESSLKACGDDGMIRVGLGRDPRSLQSLEAQCSQPEGYGTSCQAEKLALLSPQI